jgi:DNA-binding MarR family transcriptional regulator
MERRRMLTRTVDARDGRRVHLHVGAKGRRLTRSPSRTVEAAVGGALTRLPPQKVRHARLVLATLADALNAD